MKGFLGSDGLSRSNCANVLQLVRQCGRLTRRQIESATGLSWGGVTNMVNRLIEAGYLVERKEPGGHASGRTPGVLEVNGGDHFMLGVDVNDTGLSACAVNLRGETVFERTAKADFSSREGLMNCLKTFIAAALEDCAGRHVMALGVSMQGEVDGVNGVSMRLPQCPGWERVPLRDALTERFGLPVVVAHDPDCMLLTHMERCDGENMLLLRIDRSVGMAVALRGEILYGSGLWEVAHMTVDPDGPECRCGRKGCLEAYVSGAEFEVPLAMAVRSLDALFRPDTLILCGDLIRLQPQFGSRFTEALESLGGRPSGMEVQTVADAKAAMKGAALMAARYAVERLEI